MKKISIVVPCFNEEGNIVPFYKEVLKVLNKIKNTAYEIIFVDDGSSDKTYQTILNINKKDKNVKCISFSRNFGKEAALFAGLKYSTGNVVITMDSDLQHPPKYIIDMYKLWKDGYQVVKGIKKNRLKEGVLNILFSKLYNRIFKVMSNENINNSSDFNLLDRKVVDSLNLIDESNMFYRGITYWIGFKSIEYYFDVEDRASNKTKWSFKKKVKYGAKNILSFTYKPLYLIFILGIIMFLLEIGLGIDTIISYFKGNSPSGYTTIIMFLILLSSFIFISLGILGLYISQIYEEVKRRPRYIIRDVIK